MTLVYKDVPYAFRWLSPGRFLMGSPEAEPERSGDETQHQVILSRGFWRGETPVTQALWEAVMDDNPSGFKGPDRPVERVSWDDAQDFIGRLNGERDDLLLRLPSEAEWEYACRAGTSTPFSFGERISTDQANYAGNRPYAGGPKGEYREETVEVRALPANAWGLYQMHGNVWEWCRDWYGEYPRGPVRDPRGPDTGSRRVVRGGGWIGVAGGRARPAATTGGRISATSSLASAWPEVEPAPEGRASKQQPLGTGPDRGRRSGLGQGRGRAARSGKALVVGFVALSDADGSAETSVEPRNARTNAPTSPGRLR